MKTIENFKKEVFVKELSKVNQAKICGGEEKIISVASSNIDAVLNLIR